jgi:small subunit ribosomal protein S16
MVTIRLTRTGAKKRPFYHLNVAESSARRDGRFIERIGYFNPIATGKAQRLSVDLERFEYWLSVGAQPSERVTALVKQARKGETGPKVIEKKVAPAPAPAAPVEEAPAAAAEEEVEAAAVEEAGDAGEAEGDAEK